MITNTDTVFTYSTIYMYIYIYIIVFCFILCQIRLRALESINSTLFLLASMAGRKSSVSPSSSEGNLNRVGKSSHPYRIHDVIYSILFHLFDVLAH